MATAAVCFGLIFVGELPDKTAVAGLVLGTRFPWRWVFAGVAAGFATHVVIAVAAGSLLTLLPHRAVEAIVAVLFALGAVCSPRSWPPAPDSASRSPRVVSARNARGCDGDCGRRSSARPVVLCACHNERASPEAWEVVGMTASQQPPQEHAANAGVSMEDLFRGIEPIRSADVFTRDAAALFDVTL